MQAGPVENLAWNGRYADWGDSAWKSDGPAHGMAMGGWYDHPSDAEGTLQSFDTYTSWQAQNGGNNVFGDCSQQLMYGSSEHDNGQGSIWGAAGGGGLVNPSSSQFGQATNPWSTTPASRDNQHPSAYGSNGFNHLQMSANHDMGQPQVGMFSSSSTGPHMMSNGASCHTGGPGSDLSTQAASSDGRYEAASQGTSSKLTRDDSDEEEDNTPKEATQEEKDEAEEVVRLAFKEAKERKKLREKVKGASPADLQALLNARFAKKS